VLVWVPEDLVKRVVDSSQMNKFMRYVGMAEKEILGKLKAYGVEYDRADLLGVGIIPKALAVNILGEPLGRGYRNIILVDPFLTYLVTMRKLVAGIITEDQMVDDFAASIVASLIHERTHQLHRAHDKDFAALETSNQGILWAEKARSIRRLIGILEENNGEIFNTIRDISGEIGAFFESHPRANIFDKITTEFAERKGKPTKGKTPPTRGRDPRDQPGRIVREGSKGSPGVVDSSASVLKSDADLAKRRAEALNRAALGKSFSKRKKLFQALTPEERFDAMLRRLGTGEVRNCRCVRLAHET